MNSKAQTEINQFLSFRLADEQYAIRVTSIREVLEQPPLTKVPRMPDYMSGVINLRGSVVPVVDLKKRFGLYKKNDSGPSHIIVTEIEDPGDNREEEEKLIIGIFCDAVQEVLTLEKEDIEPAPRIGIPLNTEFLLGMGRRGEDFILLLNIERILSTGELTDLQGSTADAVTETEEPPFDGDRDNNDKQESDH